MTDSGDEAEWEMVQRPPPTGSADSAVGGGSSAPPLPAAAGGDAPRHAGPSPSSAGAGPRIYRAVLSKLPRRFKGALAFAWVHWRKRHFTLQAPVLMWTDEAPPPPSSTAASAPMNGNEYILCSETVVVQLKSFSRRAICLESPVSGRLHLLAKTPEEAQRWFELLSAAVPVVRRPHVSLLSYAETPPPPAAEGARAGGGGDAASGGGTGGVPDLEFDAVLVAPARAVNCELCGEVADALDDDCALCGTPLNRKGGGAAAGAAAAAGTEASNGEGAMAPTERPAAGGGAGGWAVERVPVSTRSPVVVRQLSQRSEAKVQLAFDKLDHNGDGTIRTKDIGQLIRELDLAPEIVGLLAELRVSEFLADELDQNKDGRILKSNLEHFVCKLKTDESYTSRSESSALLSLDLLDADTQTYRDCRQLLHFNSRWHEYCQSRDDALEASLRACAVSDFAIEEELGKGSAGQLWRVRPVRPPPAGGGAGGDGGDGSGGGDAPASPSLLTACVALKKVWDLSGGTGPSASEFEAEQRKDYTVPLRYPHPYLVSMYNFLENQPTLHPTAVEQQTGSGRTSYVLMELCGDNLAVHFEHLRQSREGVGEPKVLVTLLQICTVLAHLAGAGVAHRDLKLDNVTLAASESALRDEVRVIDFGCAVVTDDLVIHATDDDGDDGDDDGAAAQGASAGEGSVDGGGGGGSGAGSGAGQEHAAAVGSETVEDVVAGAAAGAAGDSHHKFLKKRRSSSLLVGNQQNWAPELWELARQKQHVRTPRTVSVTLLDEASIDPYKLDVWSVGCLPFAMLALPHPYVGRDGPLHADEAARHRAGIPHTFPRLQRFVEFVLVEDPAARPTAADAVKLLQELIWAPPSNHKERVQWLFSKCSDIVGRMRADEWLRKVDASPQDIEWHAIHEKLELEFIVDSYKRELANSILLR